MERHEVSTANSNIRNSVEREGHVRIHAAHDATLELRNHGRIGLDRFALVVKHRRPEAGGGGLRAVLA